MATSKRLEDPKTTPPSPAAAEDEKLQLQLKKESIERNRQHRAEIVAKRASAALARIQTAMNRIQKQMAAAPGAGNLKALHQNYADLESRAQAISTILSNPKTRAEFHSLDDHPDHGHDEGHHHEEDVHVSEFGTLHREIHEIVQQEKKLHQQEQDYTRRTHQPGWARALNAEQQAPSGAYTGHAP